MDAQRKTCLDKLKKLRESQLSNLKLLQAKRSAKTKGEPYRHGAATEGSGPDLTGADLGQYSVGQTAENARNGDQEFIGVSHSTKQEKKRKRPDDKKQKINKKATSNKRQSQQALEDDDEFGAIGRGANKRSETEGEVPGLAHSTSTAGQPLFSGKHASNFGQEGSSLAMKKGAATGGKERYA